MKFVPLCAARPFFCYLQMLRSQSDPVKKRDREEEAAVAEPSRTILAKLIPNTSIVVDGFKLSPKEEYFYFLSHFHSDHYGGLTSRWREKVFCSEITKELVVAGLGVARELCVALPMN